MGVPIALGYKEDDASGAQVIDGGLRFDSNKLQRLEKTFGTPTNNNLFTWSFWVKLGGPITGSSDYRVLVEAYTGANDQYNSIAIQNGKIFFNQDEGSGGTIGETTNAVFRDPNSWYNIVVAVDISNGTASNKLKIYVNGTEQSYTPANTISSEIPYLNKASTAHRISARWALANSGCFDGIMAQVYLIDGQALTPSSFGFTDPLTNTWRPKKYTGTYGNNGFYLPMDGNSPIGQDQSGRGNNWTPANFGGSNTIEKATGALPILNTDGGGKVARVGVRTDSTVAAGLGTCVLALPLVGVRSDFSSQIDSRVTSRVITNNGNVSASSTISNFYGGSFRFPAGSVSDGFSVNSGTAISGSEDFTIEVWYYLVGTNGNVSTILRQWNSIGGSDIGIGLWPSGGKYYYTFYPALYPVGPEVKRNTWTHLAWTRQSGTLRLFVDGVIQYSTTGNTTNVLNSGVDYHIGSPHPSYPIDEMFNGYLSDLRIYKGTAKYTQNFIPASTDPDILPDTPSGVAYSSNVALVPSTDGAVAVTDPGSTNLSIAASNDFNFGTGDFTVEGFFYVDSSGSNNCIIDFRNSGNTSQYFLRMTSATNYDFRFSGSSLGTFTAPSKVWNHIAASRSSGTTKIFVNGVQTNSFADTNNASSTGPVLVSTFYDTSGSASSYGFNGYVSNLHVVKGTALYTSNFTPPTGPITSVANTKLLCCKSNSSATAFDVSPGTITANGNAAATNFNPFTVNINTQRGQESGYCTLNPNDNYSTTAMTLSDGNLGFSCASGSDHSIVGGTVSVSSGKWFWEITCNTYVSGGVPWMFGVMTSGTTRSSNLGSKATEWAYFSDGRKANNNTATSYGSTFTTSDVIGVALDMDSGSITFYKNGISQGVAYSNLSGYSLVPAVDLFPGNTSGVAQANFGQKPFKFPPPAGFQPLALANTPRPTIVRPDQYVGVATYTGNGGTQSLNVGFKPDLVWIKSRTATYNHRVHDSVRGVGTNKHLYTNSTAAEGSETVNNNFVSFDTNGFTLGSTSATNGMNELGTNFVAWAWKAGGNSNTFNINDVGYDTASAAGLTAGTITPTGASINTKSGFSIITYTGTGSSATISHGLGNTPKFLIIKNRDDAASWPVWTTAIDGSFDQLYLELTDAKSDLAHSAPTSTVFTNLSGSGSGALNKRYVAYLWAEIPGFSKFGSYTGNGSTDGPMVVTGFRPRWILTKGSSYSEYWTIIDTGRDTYNPAKSNLWANSSLAEDTSTTGIDILSNGFKPRTSANYNNSGQTYIYAAFAETPSFNLYGGQANAR